MKHFISIADHSPEELRHVLNVSKRVKKQLKETGRNDPLLGIGGLPAMQRQGLSAARWRAR